MVQHTHPHRSEPVQAGDLNTELRSRGMRVTPQRHQVLAAVRELGHATPEQVVHAVEGVDLATVYRNLDLLEELGFVKHAHLGHGAPSYRPAEDDHIHVVCHRCGRVVDAEPVLVDELADRLRHESGFVLDRSHFTVFGRCRECVESDAQDDVEGSDVEGSDVEGSDVEGSDVEGSDVEGSDVEGSDVEGSAEHSTAAGR